MALRDHQWTWLAVPISPRLNPMWVLSVCGEDGRQRPKQASHPGHSVGVSPAAPHYVRPGPVGGRAEHDVLDLQVAGVGDKVPHVCTAGLHEEDGAFHPLCRVAQERGQGDAAAALRRGTRVPPQHTHTHTHTSHTPHTPMTSRARQRLSRACACHVPRVVPTRTFSTRQQEHQGSRVQRRLCGQQVHARVRLPGLNLVSESRPASLVLCICSCVRRLAPQRVDR